MEKNFKNEFLSFLVEKVYAPYSEFIYTIIGFGSFFERDKFGDIDLAVVLKDEISPTIQTNIYNVILEFGKQHQILVSANITQISSLIDLLIKYKDPVAYRAICKGQPIVNSSNFQLLQKLCFKLLENFEGLSILDIEILEGEANRILSQLYDIKTALKTLSPRLVSLSYKFLEYLLAKENKENFTNIILAEDFTQKLNDLADKLNLPLKELKEVKYSAEEKPLNWFINYTNNLIEFIKKIKNV